MQQLASRQIGTTSHTDTALFLATEWHIIIQDVVLIDPDLDEIGEFHQNVLLGMSHGPSLQSG